MFKVWRKKVVCKKIKKSFKKKRREISRIKTFKASTRTKNIGMEFSRLFLEVFLIKKGILYLVETFEWCSEGLLQTQKGFIDVPCKLFKVVLRYKISKTSHKAIRDNKDLGNGSATQKRSLKGVLWNDNWYGTRATIKAEQGSKLHRVVSKKNSYESTVLRM